MAPYRSIALHGVVTALDARASRQHGAIPATILLRNDWRSSSIEALMYLFRALVPGGVAYLPKHLLPGQGSSCAPDGATVDADR